MTLYRPYDIIKKKRDKGILTFDELNYFFSGYLASTIPDYQVSALLMAILLNGMDPSETSDLTKIMLNSGKILDLSGIKGPKIDKHSTGGVGDKISLCLAPLVACAGICNPMISGRGLGHTGGTLDKLESIPGFKTNIQIEHFLEIAKKVGTSMVGQTDEIAPLDRALYALRDVTGTVESIPLMAASIMSKKLASGVDGLVFDVKVGSGAFMKDLEKSEKLAETLISIGKSMGKEIVAIISDMNQPLGRYIGNSLEVKESIEVLKGDGPPDIRELTLILGSYMLILAKKAQNTNEAKDILIKYLDSGEALIKFGDLCEAQGGDKRVIDDLSLLPEAKNILRVISKREGYVNSIDTEKIGISSLIIGGGRLTLDTKIDNSVGLYIHKKIGDFISRNEPIADIYYNDGSKVDESKRLIEEAYNIVDKKVEKPALIKKVYN